MPRAWIAECKGPTHKGDRRGFVKYVDAAANQIEILPPSLIIKNECPDCGFKNVFRPDDLYEGDAAPRQPPH